MNTEIWLPITGFECLYEVSNLGRVRSLVRTINRRDGSVEHKKGRVLKQSKAGRGYLFVSLYKDGERKSSYVHRLVATAFLQNTGKPHVNHKDFNKSNNELNNLEWATEIENAHHRLVATPGISAVDASEKIQAVYAGRAEKPKQVRHPKQKECIVCGAIFYPPAKHRATKKTCSPVCGNVLSGIVRRKQGSTRAKKYSTPILFKQAA